MVSGRELAGYIGDIGLRDVGEAGGLDEMAGSEFFFLREPAAAQVFCAVRAKTGLGPDDFGTDRLRKIDDAGEFGQRTERINEVGAFWGTADAFLCELIVSPFVEEEVVRIGSTLDVDREAGVDEGFGNVARGPVNQEDGVGLLEKFGGVHDENTLTLCRRKVNSV